MQKKNNYNIIAIFIATFFFSLHLGITSYSNSTFISSFGFSQSMVSIMYIAGALLTITNLLWIPKLIKKKGNTPVVLSLIGIVLLLLLTLRFGINRWFVAGFFVLYISLTSLVFFEMDIFLQHFSKTGKTGQIRGLFLTMINIAWALSPFVAGYSIERYGLSSVYGIGSIVVFIMLLVIGIRFHKLRFKKAHTQTLGQMYRKITQSSDFLSVFLASTLINFFYAVMIIYAPIHLNIHLGFSWGEIGLMFMIMHVPFILLEYLVGRIADTKLGEKEMMMLGFGIAGLSALSFLLPDQADFFVWTAILFASRTGMSFAETTVESYFFKKINHDDISMISAQRTAIPLGYVLAPTCGLIIGLLFSSPIAIFVFLGILMLLGIPLAHHIHDTR